VPAVRHGLQFEALGVPRTVGHELVVGAALDEPPVVQHEDPVGEAHA